MDGKLHVRLAVKDILYVQAEHVYARIYCSNQQRILQRISLSSLLSQLPADQFLQVHRSYVVNLDSVDSWSVELLFVDGTKIPISRNRRKEVIQRLEARWLTIQNKKITTQNIYGH